MFQNPHSWDKWVNYFTEGGYNCITPPWPFHKGEPKELRKNPQTGLNQLRLATVISEMEAIVKAQPERPILIGHSVGGLIVQLLVNKGLAELGVCISSVAPNAMLSSDCSFFRNSIPITNYSKQDTTPFMMNLEAFNASFTYPMSLEETQQAYESYAIPDSPLILSDCLGEDGKMDMDLPHEPMIFVSGEQDQIIPASLIEKNCQKYTDEGSVTDYKEFPKRGHFICGQAGWREVASYVYAWIKSEKQTLANNHQKQASIHWLLEPVRKIFRPILSKISFSVIVLSGWSLQITDGISDLATISY